MTPPEALAGAVLPRASAGQLVALAATALRVAAIPSPRLDAELLVGHAFGRDRAWLHAHPDAELGPGGSQPRSPAGSSGAPPGEPIAYIRGFKEWLSLRIATDAARPDSSPRDGAAGRGGHRRDRGAPGPDGAEPCRPGRWRPEAAPSRSPSPCASEPRSRSAGFGSRPATSRPRRSSLPSENLAAHGVGGPGHARLRRPARAGGLARRSSRPADREPAVPDQRGGRQRERVARLGAAARPRRRRRRPRPAAAADRRAAGGHRSRTAWRCSRSAWGRRRRSARCSSRRFRSPTSVTTLPDLAGISASSASRSTDRWPIELAADAAGIARAAELLRARGAGRVPDRHGLRHRLPDRR